eukprot:Gb_11115 [translate_table: standard]
MEGLTEIAAIVSCGIIYAYYVVANLPRGIPRIITIIPVIGLHTVLPWRVSNLLMRGHMYCFFTWISSFKLIMLCFEVGPLAEPRTKHSLSHFMAVAAFPINLRHDLSTKSRSKCCISKTLINVCVKTCLLSGVLFICSSVPQKFMHILYGVILYLALDIVMVSLAGVASSCVGVELEPQFNKPYLSASLQDFWGKRWNLIVTSILRPSVYEPVLHLCWKIHRKIEEEELVSVEKRPPVWVRGVALVCTFGVSGLMHEWLIYFYTEAKPSWEMTLFFTFHGLCTAIEVGLKRRFSVYNLGLPKIISIPLTLAFVYQTAFWLFLPPMTRYGTADKLMADHQLLLHSMFQQLGFAFRSLFLIFRV